MGAAIKFILILIIVLYLINKVGKFFYELFFPNRAKGQNSTSNSQKSARQSDEGDVHVSNEKTTNDKNFKGGDYVDFEELE